MECLNPSHTAMINLKRAFSSAAEKIQKLLQPAKVVEYLQKDDPVIPFSLKNGTDHFTLPLQRIIFTYCPHNGDSRPLMEYLEKNLVKFAKEHSSVEVIVSCKFASPAKIEAFYNGDFLHRRLVRVGGGKEVSSDFVKEQVERLRDTSGFKAKKFKMQVISESQAVRPIYSQFLHENPRAKFNFDKRKQKAQPEQAKEL